MTRTELIIQLLKVAIGLALGAYFLWWSLEVLDRLTPQEEAPSEPVTLRQVARVSESPRGPGQGKTAASDTYGIGGSLAHMFPINSWRELAPDADLLELALIANPTPKPGMRNDKSRS